MLKEKRTFSIYNNTFLQALLPRGCQQHQGSQEHWDTEGANSHSSANWEGAAATAALHILRHSQMEIFISNFTQPEDKESCWQTSRCGKCWSSTCNLSAASLHWSKVSLQRERTFLTGSTAPLPWMLWPLTAPPIQTPLESGEPNAGLALNSTSCTRSLCNVLANFTPTSRTTGEKRPRPNFHNTFHNSRCHYAKSFSLTL